MALVDGPFDEGILRLQVKHVEFVDPRRHNQQRSAAHVGCRRRILDELHQVILEDDLARRRGYVFTNAERLHVGHGDRQPTLAAPQILEQVLEAAQKVLSARLERRGENLGIGRDEIGRGERVDELAGIEVDLARGRWVEPLDAAHRRERGLGPNEIALFDEMKDRVLGPVGMFETLVFQRFLGPSAKSHQALGGRLPDAKAIVE